MKRIALTAIVGILFVAVCGEMVVWAASESDAQTPVVANVSPSYEIVIPQSQNIPYGINDAYVGDVYASNLVIDRGHYIDVRVQYSDLVSEIDPGEVIRYSPHTESFLIWYIEDRRKLRIQIPEKEWSKAKAGVYRSNILFTIRYLEG